MFSRREVAGLGYVAADGFAPMVRHGFSLRRGGVSRGVYESLNLGFFSDDEDEAVSENWRRFLQAVAIEQQTVVHQRQVHGSAVRYVDGSARAVGCVGEGDALWTDVPDLPLAVVTADCVPVFLISRGRVPIIAAIHAGWRGVAQSIIGCTIAEISSRRELSLDELTVVAGPHIGPCCYEIGEATARRLNTIDEGVVTPRKQGKYTANLGRAVAAQCRSLGIPDSQILICDSCTCCHGDDFFSYRRSAGTERGRMGNVIMLAPDQGQ